MKKHGNEYYLSTAFKHISFYLQHAASQGTEKPQTTPQTAPA